MAYVTQIRIGDNRTVFFNGGNAKCEREMTIAFAFGELKTEDEQMIKGYVRQLGVLVKQAVEDGLQEKLPEVRPTPQRMAPQTKPEDKPAPAASAPKPAPVSKPAPAPAAATPPAPAKPSQPATQTKVPDAPETVAGEPDYDRNKLHWRRCPECGNEDIDGEYEKTNPKTGKPSVKKYQACFGNVEGLTQHAGVFLNFDGKTVPMKHGEGST